MDPISIAFGLAQYAPSIIKWITGDDKSAAVAEKVVDVAKIVTGKQDGVEAVKVLQADPALQLQFQQRVTEIDADLEKAYLADREGARKRDAEFIKAGRKNWRGDIMAYGAMIAFVAAGYVLIRQAIPPENRELIVYLLGALTVIVKDIYGFEFGSSKGSADNRELVRQLAGKG